MSPRLLIVLLSFLAALCLSKLASAQTRTHDVICMKAGGAAFTMDIFKPATLIVHGDVDPVVPLQQAQAMDQALAKAGVAHKHEVIPGGGHNEKTFRPGLTKAVQWFKDKLLS